MNRLRASILFFLTCQTLLFSQLPPEIELDKYLIAIDRAVENSNYSEAVEYFEKAKALDLPLPHNFFYRFGLVLLKLDAKEKAKIAFESYLTTEGPEGIYYREALDRLLDLEGVSNRPTQAFIVGMASDVGGLGDRSYNDGTYLGLLMGEQTLGIETSVIESKQGRDYYSNLTGLADDGSDLVFAVGFLMADAVLEAAANTPKTLYAGIDIWVPQNTPPNLLGMTFKEHEAGYLAGIVAGLMTKEYAHLSEKLNQNNVIGIVLGMDIPPVQRFEVGFIAGARSVNPNVQIISTITGSFVDQKTGKEVARDMVAKGADIIFHSAGLTGLGAIVACKEAGIFAIGSDVDQSNIAPDTVLTSAEKKISQATYLTIKSVLDGSFQGGNRVFGLTENAVGLSPFHSFEGIVPTEVKNKIEEVIVDIKAGRIIVPTTRTMIENSNNSILLY